MLNHAHARKTARHFHFPASRKRTISDSSKIRSKTCGRVHDGSSDHSAILRRNSATSVKIYDRAPLKYQWRCPAIDNKLQTGQKGLGQQTWWNLANAVHHDGTRCGPDQIPSYQ